MGSHGIHSVKNSFISYLFVCSGSRFLLFASLKLRSLQNSLFYLKSFCFMTFCFLNVWLLYFLRELKFNEPLSPFSQRRSLLIFPPVPVLCVIIFISVKRKNLDDVQVLLFKLSSLNFIRCCKIHGLLRPACEIAE
jgi:cytochrome bd-type quinol oxidase subunit 2